MDMSEIQKYYKILGGMLERDLRVFGNRVVFTPGSVPNPPPNPPPTPPTTSIPFKVDTFGDSSSYDGDTYILLPKDLRGFALTVDGHRAERRFAEMKWYHYIKTSLISDGKLVVTRGGKTYTSSIKAQGGQPTGNGIECRYHGRHNDDRAHFYVGPHFVGNVRVVVPGCIDETVYFNGHRFPKGSEGKSNMPLLIKKSDGNMEPIAIVIRSSCHATACTIYR